jgi:hypothetical protein
MNKKLVIGVLVVAAIGGGYWYYKNKQAKDAEAAAAAAQTGSGGSGGGSSASSAIPPTTAAPIVDPNIGTKITASLASPVSNVISMGGYNPIPTSGKIIPSYQSPMGTNINPLI